MKADRLFTMKAPTLEALQADLERQDQELSELMEIMASADPRDIPQAFFDELDDICELKSVRSAPLPVTFNFALRA